MNGRIVFLAAALACIVNLHQSDVSAGEEKPLIRCFPVAGVPGEDIRQVMAFHDHDPEEATVFSEYGLGKNHIADYMGGDNTYDGHQGTDIGPAGFEEQDIGIPVVAVREGVVKKTLDGVFDRETTIRAGVQGNFVLIDHGNGCESYYNHLRKGSVCVSPGEKVTAGQQIGLVGSSGSSTWPHLHFEWREGGVPVDPFSGPRNPGKSRWEKQPAYDYPMVVTDCGLHYEEGRKKLPHVSVRESYAQRGKSREENLRLWITVLNVSEESYERTWRLISPGGGYVNEWTDVIDGSEEWHGHGAEVWQYSTKVRFSEKATSGVWTLEILHDKEIARRVRLTVADEKPSNRPPESPPGGTLSPENPTPGDFITCTVGYSIDTLDPDLDRIRYRYLWELNGKKAREVTSATRRDYFPAEKAGPGETLVCKVFASDGRLESSPLVLSVTYE